MPYACAKVVRYSKYIRSDSDQLSNLATSIGPHVLVSNMIDTEVKLLSMPNGIVTVRLRTGANAIFRVLDTIYYNGQSSNTFCASTVTGFFHRDTPSGGHKHYFDEPVSWCVSPSGITIPLYVQ